MFKLNRILAATALIAMAVIGVAATAKADTIPIWEELKWRFHRAAVAAQLGQVDSTTVTLGGAPIVVDSTNVFDAGGIPLGGTVGNATAFDPMKLFIYTSSTPASTDSIGVAWDVSVDGTNFVSGTINMFPLAHANDPALGIPLAFDSDAALGSGGEYLWRYWRFRVRSDGNSAAKFAGAKIKLAHFR